MATQKRELYVTILTQGISCDSLDPYGTIRDDAWDTQYARYLALLADAVRELYPDAVVDDAPGNGLDQVQVRLYYGDEDAIAEHLSEDAIAEDIKDRWSRAYQDWCDTVPAEAYKPA